jgi:hypothetical protein
MRALEEAVRQEEEMMFGKKAKDDAAGAGSAKPKKPRDALTDEIDQLTPGQQLLFRLPEIYGPEIIIIDAIKDYQGKGPRFSMIASPPVDGKPGPTRNTMWQSSKAKAIADWLIMRSAQKYT